MNPLEAIAVLVLALNPVETPAERSNPDAGVVVVRPATTSPQETSCYVSRNLGNGRSDAGTGTVIACENGKSLVITNAHVLEDGTGTITVTVPTGKSYAATFLAGSTVRNVGPNQIAVEGPDLALCVVDAELPFVPVAAVEPKLGSRLRLWGYGGRLASDGHVLKEGVVVTGPNFVEPMMCSTINTISGDSGSGVFNEAGELVGVHHGKANQAYAVPVTVVRVFVRERTGILFPRLRKALGGSPLALAVVPAVSPNPMAPTQPKAKEVPPVTRTENPFPLYSSGCPGGVCPTPPNYRSRGIIFRR